MVRITAIITIVCCLLGLGGNLVSLRFTSSNDFAIPEALPYFYRALYTMSAVSVLFNLIFIWLSVDLIRGKFRAVLPFSVIVMAEVVYLILVIALGHGQIGMSAGAAFGLASGGMAMRFVLLLPFWAPAVLWAARPNGEKALK
jgi:hypothetical protein